MQPSSPRAILAGLLAAGALAACGGRSARLAPVEVRPDSVRTPATPAAAATAPAPPRRYIDADVRFMQRMIGHHAQALAMTAMVPARSGRDDLKRVSERIELSQRDEIALMQRWLRSRGEAAPGPDADHAHHPSAGSGQAAASMPGMLTASELAALAAARGAEFDRLFLQGMIRHHEGALAMVAELLATPGGGQEVEIFRFASDVDADQRAEIRRMRALLAGPAAPPPR